jgi:hypothetical protein
MKLLSILSIFVFSSCLRAADIQICPSEIDVQVQPRDQSIGKEISPGKEKRSLTNAQLFMGHPKNLLLIRPLVGAAAEEVVEFPSSYTEQIWAVCWYGDRKVSRLKITISLKQPNRCRFKGALICRYK